MTDFTFDTPAHEFPTVWDASADDEFNASVAALVNKHVYLALNEVVLDSVPVAGYDNGRATISVVLDDAGRIMQVFDVEEAFTEDDGVKLQPDEYRALADIFQRLADRFSKMAEG